MVSSGHVCRRSSLSYDESETSGRVPVDADFAESVDICEVYENGEGGIGVTFERQQQAVDCGRTAWSTWVQEDKERDSH